MSCEIMIMLTVIRSLSGDGEAQSKMSCDYDQSATILLTLFVKKLQMTVCM